MCICLKIETKECYPKVVKLEYVGIFLTWPFHYKSGGALNLYDSLEGGQEEEDEVRGV